MNGSCKSDQLILAPLWEGVLIAGSNYPKPISGVLEVEECVHDICNTLYGDILDVKIAREIGKVCMIQYGLFLAHIDGSAIEVVRSRGRRQESFIIAGMNCGEPPRVLTGF